MPGNSFGNLFRLTTFGESHGLVTGGVIDGCPAGLSIDFDFIAQELTRRRPLYPGSTARKEADVAEFVSGIEGGITLGTPVCFVVRNAEVRKGDYHQTSGIYRPSHADYTYAMKYGIAAASGGGRASGRETAARVIGGAVAKLLLKSSGIQINAYVSQVAGVTAEADHAGADLVYSRQSPYCCPGPEMERQVSEIIKNAEQNGDTLGGAISCIIRNTPPGLGEPVFDKLQADLAKAMLSIGSAKAFEYGLGFQSAFMNGSEYNDQMTSQDGKVIFLTNHDGGIQGGISNGQEIYFRVGFKPVPSVKKAQSTVNREGGAEMVSIVGRHDTCHIPRLVVIVESMAALVIADHLLISRASRI
ncbi:MAG: chorismate synthase [Bacteroidales bacterium]|nr:chorismate synthase [Bacteroidales bacterium]